MVNTVKLKDLSWYHWLIIANLVWMLVFFELYYCLNYDTVDFSLLSIVFSFWALLGAIYDFHTWVFKGIADGFDAVKKDIANENT